MGEAAPNQKIVFDHPGRSERTLHDSGPVHVLVGECSGVVISSSAILMIVSEAVRSRSMHWRAETWPLVMGSDLKESGRLASKKGGCVQ